MKKPIKLLGLNSAQKRSLFANANETYNIFPRGQGKTKLAGIKLAVIQQSMPRGKSVIVGRTLIDLKTLVIPEMITSLESLGYIEGVHFVYGKKPTDKQKFAKPFQAPLDYTHFISFNNGHGVHICGQDRPGTFRGPSVDFVFVDEMLRVKKDHYEEEILAANRGHKKVFGHLPFHHGIFASSSKPVGTSDRWILKFGDYYQEDGNFYEGIMEELVELELEFIESKNELARVKLWRGIQSLMAKMKYYIKDNIFYSECRVWNNIQNLGWKWLMQEYRNMSKYKFMVEILNHTLNKVEGGFYGNFEINKHVYYDSYDYGYIDLLGNDPNVLKIRNAKFDGDYDKSRKLIIAQDWGASINCILVMQRHDKVLKVINQFHVKHPMILDDVVTLVCEYYKYHDDNAKDILYFYDHTGNNRTANSPLTFAEQAMKIFHQYGWAIEYRTTGKAIDPELKYFAINKILKAEDPNLPFTIEINGNNCPNLITSMQLAPVKQGRNGISKNKASEQPTSGVEQEDATHYSDAFDIPVYVLAEIGIESDDPAYDPIY